MSKASLSIKSIEHVRGHKLRFRFSDGHSNEVDFKPWIQSLPTEEEHAYLKPSRFKNYTIHLGHAIMWGEYDIIFPLVAVYHGNPDLLEDGVPMPAPKKAVRQRVGGESATSARGESGARVRAKNGKVKA
jgi:hypothetical protein